MLTEKGNILYAIADKIRDDCEIHESGEKDKMTAILDRLEGLSKYALKLKAELEPKPKPIKRPTQKAREKSGK